MTIRLGQVEIGKIPRVVGTLSSAAALLGFRRAAAVCDIVEVRLDQIGVQTDDWLSHSKAIEAQGLPVIFTLRLAAEGGAWRRPDEERAGFYEIALENLAAVDVELQSKLLPRLAKLAQARRKPVIASIHDFTKTPSRNALQDRILEASQVASLVKIATMITRLADVETLRELLDQDWGVPLAVMGMGELGFASRVKFAKRGSALNYGWLDVAAAPGQPSAAELCQQLRGPA